MTIQKQIEAAFDALEAVLSGKLVIDPPEGRLATVWHMPSWSEQEKDALILAVAKAVLIKRQKKRKVLR